MDSVSSTNVYLNQMADKEIIQLKINCIPKGLVPLEKLSDCNDVAKNPKVIPSDTEVEDFNIGTKELRKNLPHSLLLMPNLIG